MHEMSTQQGIPELIRFFVNLFKTLNLDTVQYCQEQFCFELLSVILAHHTTKLGVKFVNFCQI